MCPGVRTQGGEECLELGSTWLSSAAFISSVVAKLKNHMKGLRSVQTGCAQMTSLSRMTDRLRVREEHALVEDVVL